MHADELATSNCSTDDLMVKPGPIIHESCDEVVDIMDLRAVYALLLLAPDCIIHWDEIRVVWRPLQR